MSPATSKPEEDCERTEDVEETREPYCDTELAEDKMNTKSEELNSAGLEGIEKSSETVVSFPGLPWLQFLITCKRSQTGAGEGLGTRLVQQYFAI